MNDLRFDIAFAFLGGIALTAIALYLFWRQEQNGEE